MIQLIQVTKSDWLLIFELRNDFYENFNIQNKPMELNEHKNYLEDQLKNPKFHHWVIEYDDEKIGYARILDDDVGIVIKKKFQNKGIATRALKLVEEKAKSLGITKLIAKVKVGNESSKRIFENNNFKLQMHWYEKEIK
jgi:RimJ/RimL family protein N-acetyltransferase